MGLSLTPALADQVLAEIREDEVVEFLRRLVRIPTVNPPGDVREAIVVCEQTLSEAGFVTRTVGADLPRPNLIAELGTTGPALCFNAHLDVVPPGELSAWTHGPFDADLVDARVYGRGAGDDKASVTAQVMAGVALARSGIDLEGLLIVNEVADEEMGGPAGAAFVIGGGHIHPDWVIVGEQTLNKVCIGEKGLSGMRVIVHGRAAHAALQWEGANAIEAMGVIISALKRDYWPRLMQRKHPNFQPSGASITKIEGGVRENVVADRCTIYLDRRTIPGEDPVTVRDEVLQIAQEAITGMDGISVEAELDREYCPASASQPDAPHVNAVLAANRYLGLSEELTGFNMATDGRYFSRAGFPTIIYGPGDPKLAHVPDEWVGVDEVVAATRAYALAAVALLARKDGEVISNQGGTS
jgi:succinyl-diaminopimelate desuccinylase